MNRLDGKIALITGGAQGQGAAEAKLFTDAGATVIITDRDAALGQSVADQIGAACTFMEQDVASEAGWQKIIDQIDQDHGRLDILVNNAGIFRVQSLEDTSLETWDELVAINQTSVFLGMRAAAPLMKKNGSGSIINLSSIAGMQAAARAHAYGATKWAVRGMSKSAAIEFAPFGIRVNSVHPGLIETQMMDEFLMPRSQLVPRVPFGRLGDVTEIAKLVLFLASDDSSFARAMNLSLMGQ